jgi:nucleoside-diphosphate kinase
MFTRVMSLFISALLPFFCLTAAESNGAQKAEASTELTAESSDVPKQVAQIEQTLSIIKPDAVESNVVGEILEYFETAGLKIVASKMTRLTSEQVKTFYAAHKDKAFFPQLVTYMTSGPVILQVLEGEDAVATNRQVMGATDPGKASPGTIRSDFGIDISRNAVHGSDSLDSARKEIGFFFKSDEIYSQQPAEN